MVFKKTIINLFSDFILSKIPQDEESIIQVVDCINFYVIKGKTSFKSPLDMSIINTEFTNEFKDFLSGFTINNIIDVIDYNIELEPFTGLTYTLYNNENCSLDPKSIRDSQTSIVSTSNFPHGFSLGQGRLFYYYGKKIVYHIPPSYPFTSLTLTIPKNNPEDSFEIYNNHLQEYDNTLRSAILDSFDFDFSEVRNEIKKANWLSESTNPLGDYPFLKRIDKELIII